MKRFPIIALVLGIIMGYWLGYYDAYRGEKAIGSMIRIAVFKASPEGISHARAPRRGAARHESRSLRRSHLP